MNVEDRTDPFVVLGRAADSLRWREWVRYRRRTACMFLAGILVACVCAAQPMVNDARRDAEVCRAISPWIGEVESLKQVSRPSDPAGDERLLMRTLGEGGSSRYLWRYARVVVELNHVFVQDLKQGRESNSGDVAMWNHYSHKVISYCHTLP